MELAITTGFSTKFIYYLFGLIKNNIKVKYIFIQVNTYRYKREKKRLEKFGLHYLPKFLINYLTYQVFKLRCSIPKYILYKINLFFTFGKDSSNIDDLISFYNLSFYKSDLLTGNFYLLLDKLKNSFGMVSHCSIDCTF